MVVRSLLVLLKIHNLHIQSIDFTLEFPQAEISVPIYLHTLQGIMFGEDNDEFLLKLTNNLYGVVYAGRTWWERLSEGLIKLGLKKQRKINVFSSKMML